MKTLKALILMIAMATTGFAQISFTPYHYGSDLNDIANDIAIDYLGNTYITGSFNSTTISFEGIVLTNSDPGSNTYDLFVVKMDPSGMIEWAVQSMGTGDEWGYGICTDGSGHIYISGAFNGADMQLGTTTPTTLTNALAGGGTYDAFAFELEPISGEPVNNWHMSGLKDDYANNVEYNTTLSKVMVVGSFNSDNINFSGYPMVANSATTTTFDAFLAELDPVGATTSNVMKPDGLLDDYATDVAIDPSGLTYMVGNFESDFLTCGAFVLSNPTTPSSEIFYAAYDGTGYSLAQTATGELDDYVNGATVDVHGDLLLTGTFFSPLLHFGTGIEVTHSSTIAFEDGDYFLAKIDATGMAQWAKGADADADPNWNFDDVGKEVVTNVDGEIYVIGWFHSNKFALAPGRTLVNTTNNNYAEIFLAKYSDAGNLIWATDAKGSWDNDYGEGIALNPETGCLTYTGWFQSTSLAFGMSVLTNTSDPNGDLFVVTSCEENAVTKPCDAFSDSLHTGIGAPGSLDPDWMIVEDPSGGTVPRNAVSCTEPTGWNPPFAGTHYLSTVNPPNVTVLDTFVFERQFYVDPTALEPGLLFAVMVDDIARIYINDVYQGSANSFYVPTCFYIPPSMPGIVGGLNTLRVEVINTLPSFMGFDLIGWVCSDTYVGEEDPDPVINEEAMKIFPNPAHDQVTISSKTDMKYVAIRTITGKLVKSMTLDSDMIKLNIGEMPTGMYLVQIQTDQGWMMDKLMVSH
jgi:hypothetical protein